jgi:hypothetical protein
LKRLFQEEAMMQDLLVEDKWLDKDGNEQTALRKVGVTFTLKGGGARHKIYENVSISGECLSLPQKKKSRGEAAGEPEAVDAGDDFVE